MIASAKSTADSPAQLPEPAAEPAQPVFGAPHPGRRSLIALEQRDQVVGLRPADARFFLRSQRAASPRRAGAPIAGLPTRAPGKHRRSGWPNSRSWPRPIGRNGGRIVAAVETEAGPEDEVAVADRGPAGHRSTSRVPQAARKASSEATTRSRASPSSQRSAVGSLDDRVPVDAAARRAPRGPSPSTSSSARAGDSLVRSMASDGHRSRAARRRCDRASTRGPPESRRRRAGRRRAALSRPSKQQQVARIALLR